jgi:hypothetical protein
MAAAAAGADTQLLNMLAEPWIVAELIGVLEERNLVGNLQLQVAHVRGAPRL